MNESASGVVTRLTALHLATDLQAYDGETRALGRFRKAFGNCWWPYTCRRGRRLVPSPYHTTLRGIDMEAPRGPCGVFTIPSTAKRIFMFSDQEENQ